jgi:hypothetical protein
MKFERELSAARAPICGGRHSHETPHLVTEAPTNEMVAPFSAACAPMPQATQT